jgi:hypothetical protein
MNIRDLYRGINDFMKGLQPRTNTVKDEMDNLVAHPDGILARSRNHFSQLLNVPGVNDVRQTEMLSAKPLGPELSACDRGMATES